MTDRTDTGESAVGTVVAGNEVAASINAIGTVTPGEARAQGTEAKATWSYSDLIADNEPDTPEGLIGYELINREELLEQLRLAGNEVSERTLRSWESAGILPRPIHRWQEPRSRSSARTVYPWWATFAVSMARFLRGRGYDERETRRELERAVPELVAGYYKGARDVALSYHLREVFKDSLGGMPWPQGRTPSVVEIRIWDQDGGELHVQKMTIPDGITIVDE